MLALFLPTSSLSLSSARAALEPNATATLGAEHRAALGYLRMALAGRAAMAPRSLSAAAYRAVLQVFLL